MILEEALREREFAFVQFRESPAGRQAYLQGTRTAVWQVAALLREMGGEAARVAAHLGLPTVQVIAAQHYAMAYPHEVQSAIDDCAHAASELARLIPSVEVVEIDATAP